MKCIVHKLLPATALSLMALLLAACNDGGGAGAGDPPGGETPPVATPTAVGTADGESVSATIGVAGGTLVTADGRVSLVIPPDALASPTTITIQPITNQAHSGLGKAYRLTPEGLTFAKPAQVTFHYRDQDMAGTAPAATGIAFQRADGRWQWVRDGMVDAAARTVSVQTSHFSDWSHVAGYQLWPQTATVRTGQAVALKLVNCVAEESDGLVALVHTCQPANGLIARVDNWSVNGVAGGGPASGTVTGNGQQGTFSAPATRPAPATVTVSAVLDDMEEIIYGNPQQVLLMSDITIAEASDYAGSVQFENMFATGAVQVTWHKLREEGGVAIYSASGTMNITTRVEGCEPQNFSFPLITSTDESATYKMQVYPEGFGERAKRYSFHLAGNGAPVTLNCGGSGLTFPLALLANLAVGVEGNAICPAAAPVYTDVAQLADTWGCEQMATSATWNFSAQ